MDREALEQLRLAELRSPEQFFEGELGGVDALFDSVEIGTAWTFMYPGYTVVVPAGLDLRGPIGRELQSMLLWPGPYGIQSRDVDSQPSLIFGCCRLSIRAGDGMFRHPLAKEITIALAVKLLALIVLFILFFGPSHRPTMDSQSLSDRLLGDPPGGGTQTPRR